MSKTFVYLIVLIGVYLLIVKGIKIDNSTSNNTEKTEEKGILGIFNKGSGGGGGHRF